MEREQVQDLLDRFRYKPNFRFSLSRKFHYQLDISMTVEQVDDPERVDSIGYSMDFSWVQTPGQFFNILFNHVVSMELHEVKEWFKVDEQPFFEPHPVLKEVA